VVVVAVIGDKTMADFFTPCGGHVTGFSAGRAYQSDGVNPLGFVGKKKFRNEEHA